ncbi:uncharacterized protein LOC116604019 [Nematostella vectensis]|uniref:uncharacterized protein LOC116604019 n=1 Tax=Nematostella vectensis TaxID=45351 RepID=UPI002077297A|nr:uncharacterized protein LOC116604019 [Nematostella vectensis]
MSNPDETNAFPVFMTPQISPKDIPQDCNGSESEEEPVVVAIDESSSSEEDDDGDASQGYVPLSMDDGSEAPIGYVQETQDESNNTEVASNSLSTARQDSTATILSASAIDTNLPSVAARAAQMDSDQVDLIRQVMSNITLPSSAIPEWAKLVPEDKWKTSLVTSMQKRTNPTTEDLPEK